MHALGFYHEQRRPDRNEYVNFYPEKLIEACNEQYAILPLDQSEGKLSGKFKIKLQMLAQFALRKS